MHLRCIKRYRFSLHVFTWSLYVLCEGKVVLQNPHLRLSFMRFDLRFTIRGARNFPGYAVLIVAPVVRIFLEETSYVFAFFLVAHQTDRCGWAAGVDTIPLGTLWEKAIPISTSDSLDSDCCVHLQ